MAGVAQERLSAAQAALRRGDWTEAHECFEIILAQEDSAEARLGYGDALWWLGDFRASLEQRERAYAAFCRRGDHAQAVPVAVWLSISYEAGLGNHAVSSGWAARAERLLDDGYVGALRGWLLLARACTAPDPAVSERLAADALVVARQSGDSNLEFCAMSQLGWSQVAIGRIEEGFERLDEAAAGSLGGEATDLFTVVFTSCTMLVAAGRCGDLVRAIEWLRATEGFIRRYGCPYLFAHCRSAYGAVLLATGEWAEAERQLLMALSVTDGGSCPPVHAEALGRLTQLWLYQGRVEEAAQMLSRFHDETKTGLASAQVRLANGKLGEAASGLTRRLGQLGTPTVEAASLLGLLVEVRLARGELHLAQETAERLDAVALLTGREAELARAALARGRVSLVEGDPEKAQRHLQAAFDGFCRLGMPLERERARLEMAKALAGNDLEAAIAEARLALAGFDGLGARRDADASAAFIRALGGRACTRPRANSGLTGRESEVLELLGLGLSNPEIARRLYVSRKTVEHHVGKILSKLGLRGRAEAAVYVLRAPDAARGAK